MATSASKIDLGTFEVRRVMIQRIPKVLVKDRNPTEFEDSLVEAPIALSSSLKIFFRERITKSLEKKTYWAVHDTPPKRTPGEHENDDAGKTAPKSPVPLHIKEYFAKGQKNFTELSRTLAREMYGRQAGNRSAGLLVLVDAFIGSGTTTGACLAVLKLENTEALTVEPSVDKHGKSTYDASVRAVTLPEEAEVFKAALFERFTELGSLRVRVSDHQRSSSVWGEEVSDYFLDFLGCVLEETPERATLHYYDWIPRFVEEVPDADKAKVTNILLSDIDSAADEIDPRETAARLPVQYRDDYLNSLKAEDGTLPTISKDTSRLGDRTASLMVEFEGRIKVWGPREAMEQHFRNEDGQWVLDASLTKMTPSGKK